MNACAVSCAGLLQACEETEICNNYRAPKGIGLEGGWSPMNEHTDGRISTTAATVRMETISAHANRDRLAPGK